MDAIAAYLATHFQTEAEFAAHCGITTADLRDLAGIAAPGPSYVVAANGMISSRVFGASPAGDAAPGLYFRTAASPWIALARRLNDAHAMHDAFTREFRQALTSLNQTTWRLADAFDDEGNEIPSGIERRAESAWQSFLDGTFNLCVADPSSASSIARKEILQEKLTAVTHNGSTITPDAISRTELHALVLDYAGSCMPFSPAEYPHSSRKRLVDDLLTRLGDLQPA
ncbi:DUF6058 family natural product biosynthesis protein [Solilutibacter silvestris]|uniref:DUF6058 family natural product biosynthesis protein n=1 Tax=Solilutibacter silvestris TaxID=1645665 RepID=UPI003D329EE6